MTRKKVNYNDVPLGQFANTVTSVYQYKYPVEGKFWFRVDVATESYLCETVKDVADTLTKVKQLIQEPCHL